MADKETRRVTVVTVSIILDREVTLDEFEQLCVPQIMNVCIIGPMKYAPVINVENIEYTELEVTPRQPG